MGGAQSILLMLARHLPRDRVEIVVAPWETGGEADATFARAIAALGVEMTAPLRWRGWASSARPVAGAIAGLVARHGIDVLHTHDNVSTTCVALARGRFPGPTVATAFGWWELSWKLRLLYGIERRLALPRMDLVYTVSQDMAAKVVGAGTEPARVEVIRTGLDLTEWAPRGTRGAVRAGWGIDAGALVVGALGRISHEKGMDHLIAAMGLLAPEFPGLVALLAGRGPDMGRLRALADAAGIGARLVMPGFVADGAAALEAMDVAVMPSILPEGFPTASVEAQAVGLPIVASDIGGTRETLVQGQTGVLVPPGDPRALAAALAPLLRDPALRARMGQAARARIAADLTLAGMLERMLAFYDRAAGDRAAGDRAAGDRAAGDRAAGGAGAAQDQRR
jgi:glycosyltransferase involved in cell wall biosynthesis